MSDDNIPDVWKRYRRTLSHFGSVNRTMCWGITARHCHITYVSNKRHMRTHAALGPWTVPCAVTSLWGFATRHTIITNTTSDSRQGPQKRPILNSCCCTKHRTGHRSCNTKEYLLSQLCSLSFFQIILEHIGYDVHLYVGAHLSINTHHGHMRIIG